jgi:hypothetical protein
MKLLSLRGEVPVSAPLEADSRGRGSRHFNAGVMQPSSDQIAVATLELCPRGEIRGKQSPESCN